MKSKLKIAYLTYYDSDTIHFWSGTVYFMRKSLERSNTEILPIHNLGSKIDDIYKAKSLYYKLIGKKYHRPREISINKRAALKTEKFLKDYKPDVVLSSGALEIAQLDTKIPLTFWSDATFHNIVDYYPDYTNLANETFTSGEYLEHLSMQNARLQYFSSDWASLDSINHYKSDPKKVKTVPFGANIVDLPNYSTIKDRIFSKTFDTINVLFVGVDWHRKGGDIALKLVENLRNKGINARLKVVGCNPSFTNMPSYIDIYGYLSKKNPSENQQLIELYNNAHFFAMPSRYEAYGIVVCESNANGLPVIGAKTGGLQDIVKDGLNGYSFDYNNSESSLEHISAQITGLIANQKQYYDLALSSHDEYATNLNWDTAGQRIIEELEKII